jgi:hypothetical protein
MGSKANRDKDSLQVTTEPDAGACYCPDAGACSCFQAPASYPRRALGMAGDVKEATGEITTLQLAMLSEQRVRTRKVISQLPTSRTLRV